MRKYEIIEYDAEDIERLENMSAEEVVEILECIKRGWLPQNYVFPREGIGYSEDQYEATRLHIAMRKAISIIECA